MLCNQCVRALKCADGKTWKWFSGSGAANEHYHIRELGRTNNSRIVSAYWLATLKRIPMLLVRRSMIAAP